MYFRPWLVRNRLTRPLRVRQGVGEDFLLIGGLPAGVGQFLQDFGHVRLGDQVARAVLGL